MARNDDDREVLDSEIDFISTVYVCDDGKMWLRVSFVDGSVVRYELTPERAQSVVDILQDIMQVKAEREGK